MQVTHEEARRLIQFHTDRSLPATEIDRLSSHLKNCSACYAYAEEIRQVEDILRPVMKRHWDRRPTPLSISALTSKNPKRPLSIGLTTRTALISLVFVAFLFSAWQFIIPGTPTSGQLPEGVLLIPSASTQSTSTVSVFESCEEMPYIVQKTDTLASIADQFGISKDQLMAFNGLNAEAIHSTMQLMIPVCNFTPTSTMEGPATHTPLANPSTSTPSG